MPVLQFGEFVPDQDPTNADGIIDGDNILPSPRGYYPSRAHAPATNPVPDDPDGAFEGNRVQGAGSAIDYTQNQFQFCGTYNRIYNNIDGVWTDVSNPSPPHNGSYNGLPSTGRWEFVPWRDKLLATNGVDVLQSIVLGTPNFVDMVADDDGQGGNSLVAKTIARIRDHIVAGNTTDATDLQVPSRVRWSAFNDETNWVVSPSTLSSFQDLKQSEVLRIIGGDYGVVFQPGSIWRMTWVGAPRVFQFDEIADNIGLIAPGAAVRLGDIVYFWSTKGFYELISGQRANPIGVDKVDTYAINDLDGNYLDRISVAADPRSNLVYFSYPGAGNEGGRPNKILVFDTARRRWSPLTEHVDLLWVTGGTGSTMDADENLAIGDPDDVDAGDSDVSWDDPRWIGQSPAIAAFDHFSRSGFFDGPIKDAFIITKDYTFNEGRRTRINGFRPIVNGGVISGRAVGRSSLRNPPVFSPTSVPARADDLVNVRVNNRYIRFRVDISGNWTQATGIQIDDRLMKVSHGNG